MQKSKFIIWGILSMCVLINCYVQAYQNGIRAIGENNTVKFQFSPKWTFIPGEPVDNWDKNFQNGIKFKMDKNCIDLDSLSNKKGKA